MDDEQIEQVFSDIIRQYLTNDEFWNWVKSWMQGDDVCERAEEWDLNIKRIEIEKFIKQYPRLNKLIVVNRLTK